MLAFVIVFQHGGFLVKIQIFKISAVCFHSVFSIYTFLFFLKEVTVDMLVVAAANACYTSSLYLIWECYCLWILNGLSYF